MNKNNNKYLLIASMICILAIWQNANTFAQNNSLIDPLNLKDNKKPIDRINYHQTRTIITSIFGDKQSKTITIKGMPDVRYYLNSSGNRIDIVIPHSYLHKNISRNDYNWNVKLRSQFPDILEATVNPDINKRDVIINLQFKYPVNAFANRKNRNTIVFKFSKMLNNNHYSKINNASKLDVKEIDTLNTFNDNNGINYKPSGKYVTVIPDSQNTQMNKGSDSYEKIDFNSPKSTEYITINSKTTPAINKPDNKYYEKKNDTKINTETQTITPYKKVETKKELNNSEPDLPNPPVAEDKTIIKGSNKPKITQNDLPEKPTPGNYSRSNNAYESTPKALPKLDRPEQTTNELLNSNDYDDLIRIAVSLESENKLEDSIQKYTQAITTNPNRYEAYAALGDVYLKLDNYVLAIQNYEKALKIKGDIVKTIFNLGVSYSKNYDSIKAISNFEKALTIQPENYEIKYNLANEYFNIKDYQKAIKYYKECIKSSEKSKNYIEVAKVKYNLANTYKANDELNKAIKEFIDSIKIFPEFADAHYNLAAAYAEKSENTKAIEEFEQYIKYTSSKSEKDRVKQIIKQLKSSQ